MNAGYYHTLNALAQYERMLRQLKKRPGSELNEVQMDFVENEIQVLEKQLEKYNQYNQ